MGEWMAIMTLVRKYEQFVAMRRYNKKEKRRKGREEIQIFCVRPIRDWTGNPSLVVSFFEFLTSVCMDGFRIEIWRKTELHEYNKQTNEQLID